MDAAAIRAGSNTERRGWRWGGGTITESCASVCSGGNWDLPEEDFCCLSARGATRPDYAQKVQGQGVLISPLVWISTEMIVLQRAEIKNLRTFTSFCHCRFSPATLISSPLWRHANETDWWVHYGKVSADARVSALWWTSPGCQPSLGPGELGSPPVSQKSPKCGAGGANKWTDRWDLISPLASNEKLLATSRVQPET